jgi:hypothetical protein
MQAAGTAVRVSAQETLGDLTFRMIPEGILSGRVTASDGQPLLRVEVAALQRRFTASGPSVELRAVAQTNDRGEYRLPGLAAGVYFIAASGANASLAAYEAFAAERRQLPAPVAPTPGGFGRVYYPNADQSSRASAIEVQSGVERQNVDLVLPKRGLYSIRGRVIEADTGNLPARRPSMSVSPAYAEFVTNLISVGNAYEPDGTFELSGIPPGQYWVTASIPATLSPEQRTLLTTPGADLSQAQLPRPARGVALVRIVDANVENVQLTIVRDLELSGQLRLEGEPFDFSGRMQDFNLQLRPIDGIGNGTPNSFASLAGNGEFVYRRLLPTGYRLTVSALGPDLYVKDARYGNVDVLDQGLLLTSPPSTRLDIVLARGAEVRGTVVGAPGNYKVVLVPEVMTKRVDLYKSAVTNAAGAFAIRGVAPGNYTAFAWQAMDDFQYFDDSFVERSRDRGVTVQLTGTTTVELRLTPIP